MPRKRKDRRRLQMAKNHGKGYDRRQTAQTHEIESQDSTRNFCLTDDSELEDFSADDSDEHSQNESESSSISAVDARSNIELPQITQRKDTLVNHGAVQTNGRLYIEKKVTRRASSHMLRKMSSLSLDDNVEENSTLHIKSNIELPQVNQRAAQTNGRLYVKKKVTRRVSSIKPRAMSSLSLDNYVEEGNHFDDIEDRPQYRIRSKVKMRHDSIYGKVKHFLGCYNLGALTYDSVIGDNPDAFCFGFDPNRMLISYLSWSFRTSFTMLFLSLNIGFFCLIIFFTFILMILGYVYPTCFQPNFNEANTPFADAYALSWTTFTTVGYGHTYPSKGVEEINQDNCYWIHILCTLESFVGVIFAGCCGAIIFGKVMRIQSLAPVIFSDPITVRYGSGVTKMNGVYDDIPDEKIPCPVLTFRLANLHSDKAGGEIVDAMINVLAIHNEKVTREAKETIVQRKRASSKKYDRKPSMDSRVVMDEDPTSSSTLRRLFFKLNIDTPENPYFKRTWTVSHILDRNSPLIIPEVQKAIQDNDGYWPSYLDDAESVRRSIRFDQIFVSVSGISVVCADSVYAQHLYSHVDMNVGYQFVPVLYRDGVQNIKVDYEVLNDVTEQFGGGGELFYEEEEDKRAETGLLHNKCGSQLVVSLPDKSSA